MPERCFGIRKREEMNYKITLEGLAPYLPYNLPVLRINMKGEWKKIHLGLGNIGDVIENPDRYRPIMRDIGNFNSTPMPLRIEQEYRALKHDPIHGFERLEKNEFNNLIFVFEDHQTFTSLTFDTLPILRFLFKYHYDVFGWIDNGLAIDIKTLNNEKETNTQRTTE